MTATYFDADGGEEALMVSSRRFKVGFDIDDCLIPWYETAHQLCYAAGLAGVVTPTTWHPWDEYGCDKQAWLDVIGAAVLNGGLYDVPPIPGQIEAMRRLLFAGHEIHLITARGFFDHGDMIKQLTREWVEQWAIPHDSLTFSQDKVAEALRLDLDYMCDDAVHNFQALELGAKNCQTYLINSPHNQTFYTPFRLDSVAEFVDMILEAAEQ